MSTVQAVFLAVVQGLTEFLPISSSGHLVIFQKIFGLDQPPVVFDISVHVGTLGAILVYFRREILNFWAHKDLKLLALLVIGTMPVAIVGLLLEGRAEWIFDSWGLVGFSFLLTALILFSTRFVRRENGKNKGLKLGDVLVIGSFQALAILPGVSRSGSTISAGIWRGLKREEAFNLSFYLAIPAIFGAGVLQLDEVTRFAPSDLFQAIVGMIVAGSVGYGSLKLLETVLKKGKLAWFSLYCGGMGLAILLLAC